MIDFAADYLSLVRGAGKQPAAFFDRDGILNVDTGYPHRPEDLTLIPGAAQAVKTAKALGYLTVVVTNQSGVARGLFNESDVRRFNDSLICALAAAVEINPTDNETATLIDAIYVCPYHPDATVEHYRCDHPDRKPNPGMIERAISDLSITRAGSFLVGDKSSDIQAAERAGIVGYLFNGENLFDFLSPIFSKLTAERYRD